MQDYEQPADNARIITTRPDIVALLRGLSSNRTSALISFFNSSAHLAGKITQINPYFDEIIFSEEVAVEAKFPPGKASLITVLSSIKAQFHAERVEPPEFEGKPAWRVRIPKMMFAPSAAKALGFGRQPKCRWKSYLTIHSSASQKTSFCRCSTSALAGSPL